MAFRVKSAELAGFGLMILPVVPGLNLFIAWRQQGWGGGMCYFVRSISPRSVKNGKRIGSF